jgi:hypothetical protein
VRILRTRKKCKLAICTGLREGKKRWLGDWQKQLGELLGELLLNCLILAFELIRITPIWPQGQIKCDPEGEEIEPLSEQPPLTLSHRVQSRFRCVFMEENGAPPETVNAGRWQWQRESFTKLRPLRVTNLWLLWVTKLWLWRVTYYVYEQGPN